MAGESGVKDRAGAELAMSAEAFREDVGEDAVYADRAAGAASPGFAGLTFRVARSLLQSRRHQVLSIGKTKPLYTVLTMSNYRRKMRILDSAIDHFKLKAARRNSVTSH